MSSTFCAFTFWSAHTESVPTLASYQQTWKSNLEKFLPEGIDVYAVVVPGLLCPARAVILLRFPDEERWKDWVLDGFRVERYRTLEKAQAFWQERGAQLFGVVRDLSTWDGGPGWALEPGSKRVVYKFMTPSHFFRYSEFDPTDGDHWYDGPPLVDDFVREMQYNIYNIDDHSRRDCIWWGKPLA